MILPAQLIRLVRPLTPFHERTVYEGMTFGLGPAGYDIRIAETTNLKYGDFKLASSLELFNMPDNLLAYVKDKSSWARKGLCVQNTVIEPGWKGYLTLELTNHSKNELTIKSGSPIAQIIFHELKEPTELPYNGKYQNQKSGAQKAIDES